jgi:hypothetical protein
MGKDGISKSSMYSAPYLAAKYIRYYLTASNGKGHGMHSPFVFQFITNVLNDRTGYAMYDRVEALRQQLLKNDTMLTVEDLGAGSTISKTNKRSIASVAKYAAKPKKYGQLLFRIAKFYKAQYIIELGTSLGLTTSYLSGAVKNMGHITTVEGSKEIAAIARDNFTKLGLENIRLINGSFEDHLSQLQNTYPGTCFLLMATTGKNPLSVILIRSCQRWEMMV